MTLSTRLDRLQSKFDTASKPELAPAVHWTPAADYPVHRWFRYREGFSPILFDYFQESNARLDPFCGCGTTLLSSSNQGVESYGIDLNPLATFVAKVKTRRYSERDRMEFVKLGSRYASSWHSYSPAPRPPFKLLPKLFQPESIDVLLRIKSGIDNVENPKVKNLLLLAWLSILEDTSNVYKEGNGLKYRNKLRRPGKYVTIPDSDWIPRYFGDDIPALVIRLWGKKCSEIADDILNLEGNIQVEPSIRTGSCFDFDNIDFGKKVDLAIFSPPYANRFDYFEAFKMELWLGGFVQSSEDMAALRRRSMRSNLAAHLPETAEWEPLCPFLNGMDGDASSVRMGIKDAMKGYFADMRNLLRSLKRLLARRGRVVIVVGNSAYAKSIIPTDLLIGQLGREEGFEVEGIYIARPLHVSSQQRLGLRHVEKFMRESVIYLKR
jgi:hypothetical protein